jgi:hypothetical protein
MNTRKSRWLLSLLGTAAAAALAGGVALALPQGGEDAKQKAAPAAQSAPPETTANQTIVTIGGMSVGVDPKTGEIQPLTKAQAAQLAAQMRKLFKPRALQRVANPDGSLSAVVAPNVLRHSVARIEADGTVSRECAPSNEAALEFLAGAKATPKPKPEEK